MTSLQSTLTDLTSLFHARMNQFESELRSHSNTPSSLAGLSSEFTAFRIFMIEVLKGLQQQAESLANSVDRLEMHSRRKILLIHGVVEKPKEDLSQVVVDLVKSELKIANFSVNAIKRCHHMGRPVAPHKHRPILIKMQHMADRDEIWFAKTKLKGTGVTLSEFLTKTRHDLFMAAREKYGVPKCWTKGGVVYVAEPNGERHKINSLADLETNQQAEEQKKRVEPQTTKTENVKAIRGAANKK